MQDGKVGLKELVLELYQVQITHLHHMEIQGVVMELLHRNITVGDIPQKVIKKKKAILIQMKKKIKKKEEKKEEKKEIQKMKKIKKKIKMKNHQKKKKRKRKKKKKRIITKKYIQ